MHTHTHASGSSIHSMDALGMRASTSRGALERNRLWSNRDVQPPKQLWRRPAGSYGCNGPIDVVIQAEDVPASVTWRDLRAKTNTQLQGFPPLWSCRVLKGKALKESPIFKNHSAVLSVSCLRAEEGIFFPLLYPQHLDRQAHTRCPANILE